MRSETLCLWGLEPYPNHLESAVHGDWVKQLSTGQSRRRAFFAVEVCWISGGAVTCRTYQVRAANEDRAACLACRRAREALGERFTRVEAVDIEQIPRGDGHE